jgi:SulP family sulfate permease
VVTGFSCGIGAMMLISQLDLILGVERATGSPVMQLVSVIQHAGSAHLVPVVLGVCVIVVATLAARFSPHAPAPLIGVALAIVVARLFDLREKEVGVLPAMLPPIVSISWNLKDVLAALPQAFALAFVSSVNILITSRVVEHFRGRHKRMKHSDADAELGAYGAANCVAGLFGAPLSVGIPARSLAVVRCGGTTAIANLVHAGALMAMLWLGSSFISRIPLPALAGVTAWMGICLLDWSAWRRLPKMSRVDAAAFLVTAFSVLAVNAVLAVALGCSLYLARALMTRSSGAVEEVG